MGCVCLYAENLVTLLVGIWRRETRINYLNGKRSLISDDLNDKFLDVGKGRKLSYAA